MQGLHAGDTHIATFSPSRITPELQEIPEKAPRRPRMNLSLKLTSEMHRTHLYEESNLFRKMVLRQLSTVDVVKFMFQTKFVRNESRCRHSSECSQRLQ